MSQNRFEVLGYVSISAGLALAASCYVIIGNLYQEYNSLDILLGIFFAFLICFFLAHIVSQLAKDYPSSPGVRVYIKKAFGNKISLIFTYMAIVAVVLVAGIEVKLVSTILLDGFSIWSKLLVGLAIIMAVCYFNVRGLEISRQIQMVCFITLFSAGLLLSFLTLTNNTQSFFSILDMKTNTDDLSPGSIASVTGLAVFLFMGFEWVTSMGKSPRSYLAKIPRSMYLSIAILFVLYFTFTLSLIVNIEAQSISGLMPSILVLGNGLKAPYGYLLVYTIVIIALITTLNAGVMSVSRLIYIVSRDNGFVSRINNINTRINRWGVPAGPVYLLSFTVALLFICNMMFEIDGFYAAVCSSFYCFIYAAFVWSFIKLKCFGLAVSSLNSRAYVIFLTLLSITLTALGFAALMSTKNEKFEMLVFIIFGLLSIFLFKTILCKSRILNK